MKRRSSFGPSLQLALAVCLTQVVPSFALLVATAPGASQPSARRDKVFRVALRRGPPLARRRPRGRSLLQLAAATEAASEPGQGDEHLYGSVFIGIPRQEFRVAFDTASGNIIVPSRLCQSSSCLSHNSYDASLSGTAKDIARIDDLNVSLGAQEPRETVRLVVGAGEVVGQLVSERVCLGEEDNLCARTGLVEATEMSEEPFGFLPYDGVMGLGMPGVSLRKHFNFLGNLAEVKALALNRFAIWLALPSDGEDSEIAFGEYDEGRVASQDVLFMRIARPETGIWQLPLEDLAVDNKAVKLCKPGACWAGFDSGTTVIAGPERMIKPLLTRLNIAQDCSNFESLPLLGFMFGDFTFNLEPSDYIKSSSAGCFHQFETVDLPPPRGPLMLLGEPFLRRFYTVFDRPTLKVGLALARHKAEAASAKELAAKLIVNRQAAAPSDE